MNFHDFSREAKEYGVSDHFYGQMRLAITGAGDKVAKLSPNHVTKADMQFMAEFGYELDVDTNQVKV